MLLSYVNFLAFVRPWACAWAYSRDERARERARTLARESSRFSAVSRLLVVVVVVVVVVVGLRRGNLISITTRPMPKERNRGPVSCNIPVNGAIRLSPRDKRSPSCCDVN